MAKAFHEDLGTISSILMITDPRAAFVMFSLCYVQRPSYVLCTVFPSPCILQHYAEFDIHTINALENIFGVRYFGGSISHLACH
jgi:hypothetical protein